jgi:hypothetical protein
MPLSGERGRRRKRTIVALLLIFALADLALAFAVLRGGTASAQVALPLHPVAGNFVPDDTQLSQCSDERCFQQAFGNIAFHKGPTDAVRLVDDIYGSGGSPACHRAVHAIGAASLARYRGNVARTLSEGDSTCGSGYYHGVLERSLVNVKVRTAESLGRVARPLCNDAMQFTPWVAYQCLHGIGHGLMIATGLSVPISLGACRRLSTRWERDACKGGVFMENLSTSYGVVSRWLKADDAVYPCNWVQLADKWRCYQMVTSRILPLVGDDWERTAEICAGVESAFVQVCFRSLGRDASSRSWRDPARILETCAVARPYGGEAACIIGAAGDTASNSASGLAARPLCELAGERLRGPCYFGLGWVQGRLAKTPAAREDDCRALTKVPELVAECLSGGRSALPRA